MDIPSKRKAKTRKRKVNQESETTYVDTLQWSSSLPDDDLFSFLVGSNEGGFLSLEELDESAFDFSQAKLKKEGTFVPVSDELRSDIMESTGDISSEKKVKKKKKKNSKKSKSENEVGTFVPVSDELHYDIMASTGEISSKQKVKKKKKKKKNSNKSKIKNVEETVSTKETVSEFDQKDTPLASIIEGESNGQFNNLGNETLDLDDEFSAWNELRLHPLLLKTIHRLEFKEPTPIQRACIPAAAHQGKDVIGAAETGSGKTLAFGLPIFQRLLEEQEKAARYSNKGEDGGEKGVCEKCLRALIVTPTRELALQVSDHLKAFSKLTNILVVPIFGGMSAEKQERLLKRRPEVIVGTPGRLWELMSGGDVHLTELQLLSFFVLDEADRMIENGHFHELQSIIDMLPLVGDQSGGEPAPSPSSGDNKLHSIKKNDNCLTVAKMQKKKRQTFVFSATIALSANFRKKLKRGANLRSASNDGLSSFENLSQRAGMRADAAIIDLTTSSIVAYKLEESVIECREEDKDSYLYYLLSVHGFGRTIVFCTSIAALRRISSLLRIVGVNAWTLHAQMQQRARLKAMDHFRSSDHGVLAATDVAARGLDIPGIRTVIHYQLPHSAEVYIHRSGRTARASSDGCSIALISPSDRSKFASLCKSFSKECLRRFPLDSSYMPEIAKRMSLARQIDKITRSDSQTKAQKNWFVRNAASVEMDLEDSGSEEEKVQISKQKKINTFQLKQLEQELNVLLTRPLQPTTFSRRFVAGAGMSPLLQQQLKEMTAKKQSMGKQKNNNTKESKRPRLVVIGQNCIEPLQALRRHDT
ncbi:DEAD-box ATP-dependent RNA helicase 13 isoform X1 [Amborella trichopoda]|uniref:DEAD-box ATP-dependent RNA helicase 13 isoform X1 n=1 Tax=Amborella trichopoda TaxID=13333 RepID=UPI0005D3B731|nr:DEAD-box ATP-dependent RNA helicase 13 isoform X1 [Amborella trichopoda]|eukprot:XP_011620421.1 DEAD-box ATP-dependent RNA helicase 13 isoform X1 [Amborella trichopoda]